MFRLLKALALTAIAALVVTSLPDLARYLKMRDV